MSWSFNVSYGSCSHHAFFKLRLSFSQDRYCREAPGSPCRRRSTRGDVQHGDERLPVRQIGVLSFRIPSPKDRDRRHGAAASARRFYIPSNFENRKRKAAALAAQSRNEVERAFAGVLSFLSRAPPRFFGRPRVQAGRRLGLGDPTQVGAVQWGCSMHVRLAWGSIGIRF